jgi:hypothetical protein
MTDRVTHEGSESRSEKSQDPLAGRDRGRQEFAAPSTDWRRTLFWIFTAKLYGLLILYVLSLRTELQPGEKGFLFLKRDQERAERVLEIEASFIERLSPYDGQFYRDIAARGYRSPASFSFPRFAGGAGAGGRSPSAPPRRRRRFRASSPWPASPAGAPARRAPS